MTIDQQPDQQHDQAGDAPEAASAAASDEAAAPEQEATQEDPGLVPDSGTVPGAAVEESLNAALRHLRDTADSLEAMPLDEAKVTVAEQVAEAAAQLDEQIGSVARSDDG